MKHPCAVVLHLSLFKVKVLGLVVRYSNFHLPIFLLVCRLVSRPRTYNTYVIERRKKARLAKFVGLYASLLDGLEHTMLMLFDNKTLLTELARLYAVLLFDLEHTMFRLLDQTT